MRALDPDRYDVIAIGITEDGRWVLEPGDPERLAIHGRALPSVRSRSEVVVTASRGEPIADVVFPVLHGPWGEDGTVQGMLELAGIPYVGSGVLASAAAMEKGTMKALLSAAGLPVGRHVSITDRQWRSDAAACIRRVEELGLPVFVKPSRAGSSRGITKVDDGTVRAAIEAAREHDPIVIVEAAVPAPRELECAVLADTDGTPMASRVGEIVLGEHHAFYDFDAKYLDDSVALRVPAELDPAIEQRIQALAIAAFDALGCEGLARVDFFLSDGDVLVNEVNTMPGFTTTSMYPRMWQASGIGYGELVDRLIADALRRGTGLR